jgi:hypothetical protein
VAGEACGDKPRHDRLCWLSQKHAQRRSRIRRVEARETEAMPLGKRTLVVLDIDCRDLTNRVTTSFTSVGNEADRIQRHKPLAASTI